MNPLILTIDTALSSAAVCLAQGQQIIASATIEVQNEQASWLQPAIRDLLKGADLVTASLDAVAVSAGPGSYTGLRIAMASAKGLCYVLKKPLICLDTLLVMARTARQKEQSPSLYCPMIDARRMEVYYALYDNDLQVLEPVQALVLNELSFEKWLQAGSVRFFGDGAAKFKALLKSDTALFPEIGSTLEQAACLAAESYANQAFADLAYAEPNYVKAFYTPVKAKC